jgi:methylenetetrahydrofolate dehydrogenase (NADP+)/methenyltetrahydrofolate cyclohydrolase
MQILNGNEVSKKLREEIKNKVPMLKNEGKKIPHLAAILVGDNEASTLYIKLKEKACLACGINFHSYLLPANSPEDKIIEVINFLNNDQETNTCKQRDTYFTHTIKPFFTKNPLNGIYFKMTMFSPWK